MWCICLHHWTTTGWPCLLYSTTWDNYSDLPCKTKYVWSVSCAARALISWFSLGSWITGVLVFTVYISNIGALDHWAKGVNQAQCWVTHWGHSANGIPNCSYFPNKKNHLKKLMYVNHEKVQAEQLKDRGKTLPAKYNYNFEGTLTIMCQCYGFVYAYETINLVN